MLWSAIYILSIIVINVLFGLIPPVQTIWGPWPPVALLVGLVFVFRDFAQRQVQHKVLYATLIGIGISYLMAEPKVAYASAVAFAVSELLDWLIYTALRRPFEERIIFSSLVSTPIDSWVFLGMIGLASPASIMLMTASKMVASVFIAYGYRQLNASRNTQTAQ